MKILITGIAGQTGSHLADYLLDLGHDVAGITRYRSDLYNINHILNRIKLYDCELRDATNVYSVIREFKPDIVFHLAATSFVKSSFSSAAEVITNNTISQINIAEALIHVNKDAIMHIACSSEQYGIVSKDEIPIKETNLLRPLSPYGVSKVAQEMLAIQYYNAYGLRSVITRTFNHTGPRRLEAFVESSFCKQVAMIEAGLREPVIYHGNLDSVRDYTDARDIARAYWLAVEKCPPGVPYNICSERYISIADLLQMIIDMSHAEITTKLDFLRLRPSDVVLLYGDCTRFKSITGWNPEIEFEQTISDLLQSWRHRVQIYK